MNMGLYLGDKDQIKKESGCTPDSSNTIAIKIAFFCFLLFSLLQDFFGFSILL